MSRAEVDLQISVRKACNTEEVPPKRKHVRACIVYTWDHKNSRAFWNAVKIQPLQSNEIQLFKALIMIHKVLQEGHPNTLKDGYRNKDFLYSLSTVFPSTSSYGMLINQYDKFLLRKLDFHRGNPGFNGIFEYEEYISLRSVNDPNEGYESILQLMDLQDMINELQKQIFATIHRSPNNLCKVSALVPLISESYGIYKFLISMLRAMYQQLGDDDALSALFDRFSAQHFVLRDFYTDCQSLKFLTSLITIPRVAATVPNLRVSGDDSPQLPNRATTNDSQSQLSAQQTSNFEVPTGPPPMDEVRPEDTGLINQQQQLLQQQQQLEFQRQQQLEEQARQQALFQQQRLEQEQKALSEQDALRQQQTHFNQSRVSELENDLLLFKNQFDNDQALLQQYDSRVKSLESELTSLNETATQQVASKDNQLSVLNEQVTNWAKKYESLAKLYSQLRSEHLNLLSKFKKIQQKISSAQESIAKKEKLEKDLKTKNLELADLIRERDRARLDLDRLKASKDHEIDQLQTQLRELEASERESGQQKSSNMVAMVSKYETEIEKLTNDLAERNMKLMSLGDNSLVEEKLREKEVDLEIMQASLDEALKEIASSKQNSASAQLLRLLDVALANSVKRIEDSKYELSSPMQAGNTSATPEYVRALVDLCSDSATDFSQRFNDFLAEGGEFSDEMTLSRIILASSDLASSLHDLMLNSKGLSKNLFFDDENDLAKRVARVLNGAETFFSSLTSDSLAELESDDDKIDFVIDCNVQLQNVLQATANSVDELIGNVSPSMSNKGDIEDIVDNEMLVTANKIESATEFLQALMVNVASGQNVEIHEAIISAALAITRAVAELIKAAAISQNHIASRDKSNLSRRDFYRKNSRWTEGLISASKAVAVATNTLIQSADGVLKNETGHEIVIVACNEVAASTAQLVAASRVKAASHSKEQDDLEQSSLKVNQACKALVTQVQQLLKTSPENDSNLVDLSKLTTYEGKTLEMEQQVEILKLENMLTSARKKLTEIRKFGYKDDHSDTE